MTAGNSTPLTDGAATVLLASDEWAAERGLPVLAHLVDAETAAVDYVHGDEGLLMAPAYAVPRMLERNGLTLQDFDFYEIHEAFAVHGARDARGVGEPAVLQGAPGPRRAAGLDRPRQAQRRTAPRSRPATRSPRPAPASSRRSPRRCSRERAAAADSSPSAPPAARASSPSSRPEKEPTMSHDWYSDFVNSGIGKAIAGNVGLPAGAEAAPLGARPAAPVRSGAARLRDRRRPRGQGRPRPPRRGGRRGPRRPARPRSAAARRPRRSPLRSSTPPGSRPRPTSPRSRAS